MNKIKLRIYRQEPKIICGANGLVEVLVDVVGNEFRAEDREVGNELTIDYPPRNIFDLRVIDYVVCLDSSGKKYWGELGRRQWIPDGKLSFFGKWKDSF